MTMKFGVACDLTGTSREIDIDDPSNPLDFDTDPMPQLPTGWYHITFSRVIPSSVAQQLQLVESTKAMVLGQLISGVPEEHRAAQAPILATLAEAQFAAYEESLGSMSREVVSRSFIVASPSEEGGVIEPLTALSNIFGIDIVNLGVDVEDGEPVESEQP